LKGDLTRLEVVRPRTLGAALAALAEANRPMPVAGGTDLYVAFNDGRAAATRYLDLSRLDSLRGIDVDETGLRLGARTTYTDLRRSRAIARKAPILAAMAATVGAVAIQNRGTLGGSLGNASPAADPAPVLMALDAVVELARRDGRRTVRRRVPIAEFFLEYRVTAARPDELVTALRVPAEALRGYRYGYRKVGSRRAQAISKVVGAVGLRRHPRSGEIVAVRIGFGSVAPTPVRCPHAEARLLGEVLAPATVVAAAGALADSDIAPIDDLRSTADYRRRIAARLLADLLATIGGFPPPLDLL